MTDNSGVVIAGLFAAVATPVHGDGRIDFGTLDRLIDFLVEAGVSGVCLGGATGEYPHFETEDRKAVIRHAARRLPRDRALLVGIGGPSVRHTIDLGETALQSGSRGLLLPMPMFFRYEQEDLQTFCTYVSDALRGPCLLYNLPDFTNGLDADTVVSLLRDAEFIVGIKDSSGQIENLDGVRRGAGRPAVDAARRRRSRAVPGTAGRMERRHLRRRRVLPGTARRDLPEPRGDVDSTRPRVFRCCSTS